MEVLTAFMIMVHGVAFDARMKDKSCVCNSQVKSSTCQIQKFPVPHSSHKMIVLTNGNSTPINAKVYVNCVSKHEKETGTKDEIKNLKKVIDKKTTDELEGL